MISGELLAKLTPSQLNLLNAKKKKPPQKRPTIIIPGTSESRIISEDFEAFLILTSTQARTSIATLISTLINTEQFFVRPTRDAPVGVIVNVLADETVDVLNKTAAITPLLLGFKVLKDSFNANVFTNVVELVAINDALSNLMGLQLFLNEQDDINYSKAMITYYSGIELTGKLTGSSTNNFVNALTSILAVLFVYDLQKT